MNIGAQLRQARESRGLSIAALSSTTRISPRILEAIERNDASVIPPRPYGRGFVSVFAREVGLDADDMVHEFFAQFGGPPAVHPPPPSIAPDIAGPPNWRRWGTLLGAVAVLLILGLLVTRTGVPAGNDPAAVGTTGDGGPSAATPSAPNGPTRPDQLGGTRRGQTAAALVVTLEAEGQSWLSATADGTRVLYRLVDAGTTETIRATREITIRVGDAGAVLWSVNGRQAVPMGHPGEVRTVTVKAGD
jgi:cytoskeleton protein RodZ